MRRRTIFVFCLVVVFSQMLAAQTYPLSEVEVRLVYTPHGGCLGPCVTYEITVRGDGSVEYHGQWLVEGSGSRAGLVVGTLTRIIPADDVVRLVNEFLQARFWDALYSYRNKSLIVRTGDTVTLYGTGSSDDPQFDLTLKIGDRKKTVSLFNNYPVELGRLVEHVKRIGGPQVWQ